MRLPALSSALVLLAPALAAAEQRNCGAAQDGVVTCLAGRQCLCRYEPGGSLIGRPAGFRWDCGVLRPFCTAPPAELTPPADPVPLSDLLQAPQRPWR